MIAIGTHGPFLARSATTVNRSFTAEHDHRRPARRSSAEESNRKEVLVPSRTHRRRNLAAGAGIAAVAVAGLLVTGATASSAKTVPDRSKTTASPIKHLVVIFDENVSYDHYFGTYPKAKNTDGTPFYAVSSTPKNNNLVSANLL